jgi:hypothetical protein
MAETKSTAATVGGVIVAIAATVLGRFLGWMFGLQLILPLIAGLAAAALLKKKMPEKAQVFVPALSVHAAYLAWIALDILVRIIQGNFYIGILGIVLHLVAVVAFVALIVQPGMPPALLLILRHAYSLILVFLSLPSMIKSSAYVARGAYVNTVITAGIAIAVIVLLVQALRSYQET